MKKAFITFISLVVTVFIEAQSIGNITWLGVDFSHVKMVGEFNQIFGLGENSPSEIQDKYFPSWNMLFISEASKYDVKDALRKEIYFDIDSVMKRNEEVDASSLTSYNT